MFRKFIPFGLLFLTFTAFTDQPQSQSGVVFRFKSKTIRLERRMGLDPANRLRQRGGLTNAQLDTLSNVFYTGKQYVEIIRQDDSFRPTLGMALGFEFDETNGEYPYTPAHAVIQLKDFGWGGVEFSTRDTLNYTGISDSVSEDISIQVDSFFNDTITGRFSGLLLSGAGPMAPVDSGSFCIRLFRKK